MTTTRTRRPRRQLSVYAWRRLGVLSILLCVIFFAIAGSMHSQRGWLNELFYALAFLSLLATLLIASFKWNPESSKDHDDSLRA